MFYLLPIHATSWRLYGIVFSLTICAQVILTDSSILEREIHRGIQMRYWMLAAFPESRSFSIWNFVLTINGILLIYLRADPTCTGMTATQIIMNHVVLSFGANIMCFLLETAEWNRILELQRARSSSQRLLNGMCDVVARLGDDKTIIESAPKLAALLGLPAESNALLKTSFTDLVAASERQRVQHALNAQQVDGGGDNELPVQALAMQLEDAHGVGIEVNTFFFKHAGFDGTTSYLLGMCDTGRRVHRVPVQSDHHAGGTLGPQPNHQDVQPDDDLDDVSQTRCIRDQVSIQSDLGQCGVPENGDVNLLFNSWTLWVQYGEPPDSRTVEIDLLQHEQLMKHMLELRGQMIWMQDLLTEILQSVTDDMLENRCLVKFHLAFGGVYSVPGVAVRLDDQRAAVINNLWCMNFMDNPAGARTHIMKL